MIFYHGLITDGRISIKHPLVNQFRRVTDVFFCLSAYMVSASSSRQQIGLSYYAQRVFGKFQRQVGFVIFFLLFCERYMLEWDARMVGVQRNSGKKIQFSRFVEQVFDLGGWPFLQDMAIHTLLLAISMSLSAKSSKITTSFLPKSKKGIVISLL